MQFPAPPCCRRPLFPRFGAPAAVLAFLLLAVPGQAVRASGDMSAAARAQIEAAHIAGVEVVSRYNKFLARIFEVRDRLRDVHPFIDKVYPVAVAEDGQFLIFSPDPAPASRRYVFVKQVPAGMPIPKGVRAAFPLDPFDNRMTCVVTGDVFDTLEGYVVMFHEFIHCFQWETIERPLKEKLSVYRKAMAARNYMWEIDHPFPYNRADFVAAYKGFLTALADGRNEDVLKARAKLRQNLAPEDWEYMTWQEWKEGSARYIENLARSRLGLKENHGGGKEPFDRVTFYEGGSRLIAWFESLDHGAASDLERLYTLISR